MNRQTYTFTKGIISQYKELPVTPGIKMDSGDTLQMIPKINNKAV